MVIYQYYEWSIRADYKNILHFNTSSSLNVRGLAWPVIIIKTNNRLINYMPIPFPSIVVLHWNFPSIIIVTYGIDIAVCSVNQVFQMFEVQIINYCQKNMDTACTEGF